MSIVFFFLLSRFLLFINYENYYKNNSITDNSIRFLYRSTTDGISCFMFIMNTFYF